MIEQAELDKLTKDEEMTRNTLEETAGRYNTENAVKKALVAEVCTGESGPCADG